MKLYWINKCNRDFVEYFLRDQGIDPSNVLVSDIWLSVGMFRVWYWVKVEDGYNELRSVRRRRSKWLKAIKQCK